MGSLRVAAERAAAEFTGPLRCNASQPHYLIVFSAFGERQKKKIV